MITHRQVEFIFVDYESFFLPRIDNANEKIASLQFDSIHCQVTMSQLDILATFIPQELRTKLMQHFGIAKEYESNSQTLAVTYYCLMYIANEALKLQKDKYFVSQILDYLERIKRTQTNDERILSMTAGQSAIEELINSLVNETLDSDHDENLTVEQLRILMKKNYTVGGLVDVLSVFGPVNEDFVTLGKIAKTRAVSIFRDLKSGQHSNPNNRRPISSPSTEPSSKPIVSPVTSETSKDVPFTVITEAQKLFRFANSALEHDDVRTAVNKCEQVLQLLQPYR